MTKDELKALGLTEEQVEAIHADYGKNYVSKSQFNSKNEEVKELRNEKAVRDSEIEKLKEAVKDNEALTAKLNEMQEASKQAELSMNAKLKEMTLTHAVEQQLTKAQARDNIAVKAFLDMSKLVIADDGTVSGLKEQVDAIKAEKGYLFNDAQPQIKGVEPQETGGNASTELSLQEQFTKALGF